MKRWAGGLSGYQRVTVAALLHTLLANIALNRIRGRSELIIGSTIAAGGVLALAMRGGATARELGLAPDALRSGARAGLAFGVPIGSAVTAGVALRPLRRFYLDERITSASVDEAGYQLAVRIPLLTAAAEELLFRGGLEALFAVGRPRWVARVAASVLFGLWHVLPTLERLHSNPGVASAHEGSRARRAGAVASTVAATSAAGVALSVLRQRSGSIAAPIIVHAAINGGGYLAGWVASRRGRAAALRQR